MASSSQFNPAAEGLTMKRRDSTSTMKSFMSGFSRMSDNGKTKRKDEVVVYDPLEKLLLLEEKANVKGTEKYVRVPIKGTDLKVSIFMELPHAKGTHASIDPAEKLASSRRPSVSGSTPKVFIATVDLGRLGKWVKQQRKKNQLQAIYILGQNPIGFASVPEEDSD